MSFLNKAQTPKRLGKGKGNHQVWGKKKKFPPLSFASSSPLVAESRRRSR